MAIDRNFESALLKAADSLEINCEGLSIPSITAMTGEQLMQKLHLTAILNSQISHLNMVFQNQKNLMFHR